MIGQIISHYKILENLGEGGMGVVYKAEDTKLKRTVALKFLSSQSLGTQDEKTRFVNEAQATAALDHPNICTVYEIDESDGYTFIAMAYLDGQSLREKTASGPLKLEEALRVAIDIARGLQEAHEKDIVHRDIKSANVMVTKKGHAKITDFGLVKLAGRTRLTKTGMSVGTAAYMSPEQARGEDVDHRTDIWSLGVVLYEMLTGQLPFTGDHEQAATYQIVHEDPEPITAVRTGIPMELERLIDKAMQKKPENRYQHTKDMLVDLRAVGKSFGGRGAAIAASNKKRLRFRIGAAALVVTLIFAGLFVGQYAKKPASKNAPTSTPGQKVYQGSIAVLPLENLSGNPDQEYFADGMTEALITQLAQIRALKVISRTSVMRYKGTQEALSEIASKLEVGTILEGSVLLVGQQVRINAQLIDGATDSHVWAKSYEGELSDVIGLQGEVARAVAEEIKVQLTSHEQARLTRRQPVDAEVYRLYLKGRYHLQNFTSSGVPQAMTYFEQVIEKDPNYALAYVGLADSYLGLVVWGVAPPIELYSKAKEMAQKAIELDSDLAEAYATLASVSVDDDWNWAEAEANYKRAIALNPNYPTAHLWYAELLTVLNRHEEAINEIEIALELDPLSVLIQSVAGHYFHITGDFDRGMSHYQQALELDPDYFLVHAFLFFSYMKEKQHDEAFSEALEMARLRGMQAEEVEKVREVYRVSGIEGIVRLWLASMLEAAEQRYVSAMEIAQIYGLLGEKDAAFHWLEKAYEERAFEFPKLAVLPAFESLHLDPRFSDLVERIGLEK